MSTIQFLDLPSFPGHTSTMRLTFKAGFFNAKKALILTTIACLILATCVFVIYGQYAGLFFYQNVKSTQRWPPFAMGQSLKDDPDRVDYSFLVPQRVKRYKDKHDFCKMRMGQTIKPSMFRTVLYSDRYRVLYCAVPKVACTNWARVFLILSGHMNTSNPMSIRAADVHGKYSKYLMNLGTLPEHEIKFRLDNYYKFVFTRDPFERILSAYLNKLKSNNTYFHSRYGKKIVNRFRVHDKTSNLRGNDVTFREYVQYLTDFTRTEPLNGHWQRMSDLCHPCLLKYDFIGSMENMNADSDLLLEKIGASDVVKFPSRSATYKHPKTKTFLRDYYSMIPPATLDQLFEVYYPDFLMFNLTIPKILKNLHKWQI